MVGKAAAAAGAEGRATPLVRAIGCAAAALGPAAVDAPGVEVPAWEGRSGAPIATRNEPHESSSLLGLEDIKFERERGVSETRKVKGEMKMKEKRGLYRGGG